MWQRRMWVAILLAVLVCAGCGDHSRRAESTVDETATDTVTASSAAAIKPIRCLDASGLSGVDEQVAGLWSGRHAHPAYTIVVHKLERPAKAPRVVAGEYAVTGSFKVVAVGTGLVGDEGIQADALVQIVAECLGS